MKKIIALGVAGILAACSQPAKTPSPENAAQSVQIGSETTDVKSIITVEKQGNPSGQTIVLIHGLASSSKVWGETAANLQDFDLRLVQVSGFAGAPIANVKTDNFTDTVAAAIYDNLVTDPARDPVIIGHSMGGFIALKTAMLPDSPAQKLIIVDSLPFLAEMMMPGMTAEQAASGAEMLAAQMKTMPRTVFDAQQKQGAFRMAKTKAFHETLTQWSKSSDQNQIADVMAELLGADIRDDLSRIKAEITVLVAYDPMMGVKKEAITKIYENQYAGAPNHKIIVIEDSFHFIMVDQKEAFIAHVMDQL